MAMSRQKKLDKMDVIELAKEKPKPEFQFQKQARAAGRYIFQTEDLVIGYDEPLSRPLTLSMERGQKDCACRCKRDWENHSAEKHPRSINPPLSGKT